MALSVLFRANPAAYKEFLGRLRTSGASKPPRKSQDIIKGGGQAGAMPPAAGVAGAVQTTTAEPKTGTNNEARRVYGGKYIKESLDARMLKEFNFFINQK
jgi:hypothetical protein